MQIKEKNEEYYSLQNSRSRHHNDNNLLLNFFEKVEVSDKTTFSILDIGCRSHANLVRNFLNLGFINSYGIDIGADAEEVWQSYAFKENLKKEDIHNGIPFDINFNLISCSHTLEHCYDPALVLSIIYKKLELGGYYWCQVPLQKSEDIYEHKSHYCYFESHEEHLNFIKDGGFDIVFDTFNIKESCVLAKKHL